VRWFRMAAEQGHEDAARHMCNAYSWGSGVPSSKAEALRWLLKSRAPKADEIAKLEEEIREEQAASRRAELTKLADAASERGEFGQSCAIRRLMRGEPEDEAEAVKFYRIKAEKGDAEAWSELGSMYSHSWSVIVDKAEAVKCYLKAAELGDQFVPHSLYIAYRLETACPETSPKRACGT